MMANSMNGIFIEEKSNFTPVENKHISALPYSPSISKCDNVLQCKHLLMRSCNEASLRVSTDGTDAVRSNYSVSYWEICSTALSIIVRSIGVYINIKLASNFYAQGHYDYFLWTIVCIVLPISVTILIHANMCYQDGKFNQNICRILSTIFLIFTSSFFFRYWNSLIYAIKCKKAEISGKTELQLKYYKLNIREESDVAFIRLFECFLEAAPQKILQISIVLSHTDKISNLQIIAISLYFGSMAWCLATYHRYNRYAQNDKYNMNLNGVILQLCWHFCISVSRTLCIAFVASIFPISILLACLCHGLILGIITFIMDRPKFAKSFINNLFFSLILGIVYVFTYIPVRDAPTRSKYTMYYILCSIENLICIGAFISFAPNDLRNICVYFYALCCMALIFYYFGLIFMMIYYVCFHPRITSRIIKRQMNVS